MRSEGLEAQGGRLGHGRQCRWSPRAARHQGGDSETESLWSEFIGSLIITGFCGAVERGLTGVKLVISDAHVGLTKAIRRMLQGSCRQR
ncbi:transposase [Synechococcus sp. CS-1329]|nr:transposase [Synechococcus sp. CS-1329]